MTTLDINFYGFEKPTELAFFKSIGIAISSFTPGQKISDGVSDDIAFCLKLTSFSAVRQVAVDVEGDVCLLSPALGFLYAKSHTISDIALLKKKMDSNLEYRIFYVCHTFLDLRSELEKLENADVDLSRITYIVSNFGQIDRMHSKKVVQSIIKHSVYSDFVAANSFKENKAIDKQEQNEKTGINFFFLIRLMRFFLAPGYFVKRVVQQARVSNFIWILRFEELFLFLFFLAGLAIFKFFGLIVDFINLVNRNIKPILTWLFYRLRHLLLMTGFKSFGFFVDLYQIVRTVLIKSGFFVRHHVLMAFFKSYGLLVDFYYVSLSGLRFIISILRFMTSIVKVAFIKTYFMIRHLCLMTLFKVYGFLIDSFYLFLRLVHFSIRFTHLYLMFPIYKIYWFCQFQYKKRVKKEIQ